MASFEGPAPLGGELLGGPAPSLMTGSPEPEVPKLSPERAQQELARLTAIIKDNPSLQFLEPRVIKCLQDGVEETNAFLSFYRLISQSLSEELVNQKERIKTMESDIIKARQISAQTEMEQAFADASEVVNRTAPTPSAAHALPSSGSPSAENSAQVDELLKRLEQAEVQRERLLQDMQNMRNRAKTDIDVKVFKAVEKFTQSLLPALDAFHQAMPALKNATDTASIVIGIEMIHEQLQTALIQAGLKKMIVVGQKFDPRFHEAIGEVETWDVDDDHIYDELQPGYEFGERMIRAAIVRIGRNTGAPPTPASPQVEAVAPAPVAEVPSPAPAPVPAPQVAAEAPPAPPAEVPTPAPTAPPAPAPELQVAAEAPPVPPVEAAAPAPVAEAPSPAPVAPPAPVPAPQVAAEAPPVPPVEAVTPAPVAEVPAPAPVTPSAPVPVPQVATEAPPAPPAEAAAPAPVAEVLAPAPVAPSAPVPEPQVAAEAPPAPPAEAVAPAPVAEVPAPVATESTQSEEEHKSTPPG